MPYERSEAFSPAAIGFGEAESYNTLANALNQFSDSVNQIGSPIVSDLGAKAGLTAGLNKEGDTRVPVGPYNRAYNESFVKAYTLSAYADSEQEFMRLEQEAQGDPVAFQKVAEERRDATVAEALPAARPFLRAAIDERMNSARSRLQQDAMQKAEQQRAADTVKGLDAVRKSASRALTSGTEEGRQRGTELSLMFMSQVDQAVNAGVFNPIEGQKIIDSAVRQNAVDVNLGRFEAAMKTPGGDPIKVIREALVDDNPAFSDEDRQALGGEMMQRLQQAQALERAEQSALGLSASDLQDQRYSEGMVLAIGGGLSSGWLIKNLKDGSLKPENANTLRGLMGKGGSGAGAASSNSQTIENFIIKGQTLTIADVSHAYESGELTDDDRNKYLQQVVTKQEDWLTSPEFRQGKELLANAAGVSLDNIGVIQGDMKTALTTALLTYESKMNALLPEERVKEARNTALSVVGYITKTNLTKKIEDKKKVIAGAEAAALKNYGAKTWDDLSDEVKQQTVNKILKARKEIAEWEAQRAQP